MDEWNDLLNHLAEFPRENGTPSLQHTASYLADLFKAQGIEVHRLTFTAYPYGTRMMGVFVLAACVVYFICVRRKRWLAAGLIAVAIPILILIQIECQLPLFGYLGPSRQDNIAAHVPARSPTRRIILAAHYDTKTDLFDHVVRTPIQIVGLPLCGLMLVVASLGLIAHKLDLHSQAAGEFCKLVGIITLLYGPLFFLAYSAGAFVPARSPGALDDGAACAVLVRTAEELAHGSPLERTDLEVLLFSGEEPGAQGAADYVARHFDGNHALPTYVVNLDPVGASMQIAVVAKDATILRAYRPDPRLVSRLDRVFRGITGKPLGYTAHGGLTDAVPFHAHQIPAVTIISEVPPFEIPRGMHSAGDTRSRIDTSALNLTKRLLIEFLREVDTNGL